ncbi:MAG: ubiquinol-cytochrome c reductase iron-sulfur subunit [Acidobacteriota bacterium]|jgi:menaquinol-cytochrome c reductase iron-sulfur subunit
MAGTNEMVRRGFFARATEILGAVIAGGLGVPALVYLLRPARTVAPGGYVDAVDLNQLKMRAPEEVSFQRIRKDGWKLITEKATAWVVKLSENEVVAYSPMCTHLGCAYHFEAAKNEFICPCHTTNFAIDGRVLNGPAPRPLDRYPVKVQGTRLLIGTIEPAKPAGEKKGA